MKTYLALIKNTQNILLFIGIFILVTLPSTLVFLPQLYETSLIDHLYSVAHTTLFFVMVIRPLADICTGSSWIRPLVILRKGVGVLSAAIIVSFILAKVIVDPAAYILQFGTSAYWSVTSLALFAHLADISAILLLVTSNNFSKRVLGSWWKRIQKLSYVYFYGSGIFVSFAYGNTMMLWFMGIVTVLTGTAYYINMKRRATITASAV